MRLATSAQWAALLAGTFAASLLLQHFRVPGGLLVGPMLCGVAFAGLGGKASVPRPVFVLAQGLLGCLIAHAVTAEIVATVLAQWPVMVAAVLSTIVAAALVSYALTRWGTLPGTVPAWGLSPGAGNAMIVMAEEYGSDPRLVAFIQYFRAVSVVVCASMVTLYVAGPHQPGAGLAREADVLPLMSQAGPLLATLALAVGGSWLGTIARIPSGGLLGPILIGSVLHATGLLEIVLPGWLLALAYAVIGLYVGLRFTRETIRRSLRALPEIALATAALIGLSAAAAWLLARVAGIDFLTAFLATSPGGLDSVSIIAIGTDVDLTYVLALQTLRLFVVTLTSPVVAKLIARAAGS